MKILLTKGRYYFKERDITYNVENDIILELENSLYIISGNNGIGKTAFLEFLLLPLLKRNKLNFAYLEQNKNNQLYTIESSLAFCNKLDRSKDIYLNWLEVLDYPKIIVADEFDKYSSSFTKILSTNISCIFLVSHLKDVQSKIQFKNINNINIYLKNNKERVIKIEKKYKND